MSPYRETFAPVSDAQMDAADKRIWNHADKCRKKHQHYRSFFLKKTSALKIYHPLKSTPWHAFSLHFFMYPYLHYNSYLMAIAWLFMAIYLIWNTQKIGFLKKGTYHQLQRWPPVTIIIAARNEGKKLRETLQLLLQVKYPNYNIT